MPRALIDPARIHGGRFDLSGPEAHHLVRVVRKSVGDVIEVFDGAGKAYKAKITAVNTDAPSLSGQIIESISSAPIHARIRLIQALPKGTKIDTIIEKCTELGVDEIIPFLSEHSVIKLTPAQSEQKIDRWQRVAQAASKQAGRDTVPVIAKPQTLEGLQPYFQEGLLIVPWEKEKSFSLKAYLKDVQAPSMITIVIGPEGGFSEAEIHMFESWGARTVTLGRRILRTETAGAAVLAMMGYALDLF